MLFDYPAKHLWDIERRWNIGGPKLPMRERVPMAGTSNVDIDLFINSPFGEKQVALMENYILYEDPMDPELVEKYRKIGLKKEMFETENLYTRWALFTPLSMYEATSRGRLYPLLFVLHGATMPIDWEECSGFLPLAARDEVIVVSPQNHNEGNIMRLLDKVCAHYPVDKSRIYSTGYSQGGMKTNHVTLLHPEIFAAAAPCGMHLCLPSSVLSDEQLSEAAKYELPIISISGCEEMLHIFPVCDDMPLQERGRPRGIEPDPEDPTLMDMDIGIVTGAASEKIILLKRRLKSASCRDLSIEECNAAHKSSDRVTCRLGFPSDNTEILNILGVEHYVAGFKNKHGHSYLKIVGIDNMPHWPPASMAELAWDFMKRFSRDMETKEIHDSFSC